MEKLLKSSSPDHKLLHEVDVNSLSSQMFGRRDENDSGLEVLEVGSVSSDRESMQRQRNPPLSPGRGEIVLNSSIYDPPEVLTDDRISAPFKPYHSFAADGISTTNGKENGEKVISVDVVSNREGILTDYESVGIASDVENYVDAPLTVDSEMDSEPKMRMKNGLGLPPSKSRKLVSNANEELLSGSSDSHLTGCSTASDEENNLSRKEMSIFCSSDSPSASVEIPQPEKYSEGLPSADIPEIEVNEASSYPPNAEKGFPADQHQQPLAGDDTYTTIDASNNPSSDIEQPTSGLIQNEPGPTFIHSDTEMVTKNILMLPGPNEISANRILNECYSDVSFELQNGNGSVRPSAQEHLVDERNGQSVPCLSTVSDIGCPAADTLVAMPLDFPHKGESDKEDSNLVANINSRSNLMPSENPMSGKLDNAFPEVLEYFSSSCPDNAKPMVTVEENLIHESNNEASLGNKLDDVISLANAPAADGKENCSNTSTENQFSSENLILSHFANSRDCSRTDLDAEEYNVPEPRSENIALESPRSCEVVGFQETRALNHAFTNDLRAPESSCHTLGNFEEPARTSDPLEINGIDLFTCSTNREVAEIPGSSNEADIRLDKCSVGGNFGTENAVVANIPSNASLEESVEQHMHSFEVSGLNELDGDKAHLTGFWEESSPVNEEGQREVATSDSETAPRSDVSDSIPISHCDLEVGVSLDFVNQSLLNQRSLDTERQSVLHDHDSAYETLPADSDTDESEVQEKEVLPPSRLDVELLHLSLVDARGRDTEYEVLQQSDLQNHVILPVDSDAEGSKETEVIGFLPNQRDQELYQSLQNRATDTVTLLIDCDAEESKVQEKIGLPPNEHDQDLCRSNEMNSELSSLFPGNQQKTLDHENHVGASYSSLNVPLANHPNSPSISAPSELNNNGIEATQINLLDLPPLPPLPPFQWRMGKIQHSLLTEGEMMKYMELLPQLVSPLIAPTDGISYSSLTASADNTSFSSVRAPADGIILPTDGVGFSSLTAPSDEINPSAALTDDGVSSSSLTAATKDVNSSSSVASIGNVNLLNEVMNHALVQTAPETTSLDKKVENCSTASASLEANDTDETADFLRKIESKQLQLVVPAPESDSNMSAEEDGDGHEHRPVKLRRPHNPLVEDVAVLDMIKLRKVSESMRPEVQKVDERYSVLEQIRTKSYNLKPAMASRPSIQGPKTNLNVAAILEKANAIHQACAGSSDEDDDSWSDS